MDFAECWRGAARLDSAQASIAPQKPSHNIFIRPYSAPAIPPVRPGNSMRLRDLIRAGKLYLTAQDAIALALENNIDIETDRYNPLLAASRLKRSEAGGPLPGVPSGASQVSTVTSGQGVAGTQAAAGVSTGGSGGAGNGGNTTITQVGPVTPTLDPTFQSSQVFSHLSAPQSNSTAKPGGKLDLEQAPTTANPSARATISAVRSAWHLTILT